MKMENLTCTQTMFRPYITGVLIIFMGSLSLTSLSQEIQFSQYDAFSLYLNPALTGKIEQQRISFNSRSQWVNIDGAFNTIGFSYDYNWKKIKSGLGLIVAQDESSGGGFSTFTAGGLYSYHLRFSEKLYLYSGVRISYIQQKLNPGALTFADQLIRNDGSATYEVFDNLVNNFVDFSWGNVLYYSDLTSQAKSYWLGLALDHLSTPKISFKGFDGKLPVKFTVHGGAQYRLNRNEQGFPENVISLSFLYKAQLKWDQAELGVLYIRRLPHKKRTLPEWKKTQAKFEPSYKQNYGNLSDEKMPMPLVYFEAGLSYRGLPLIKRYEPGYSNHDAVIVLAGLSYYNFKIAYSFDLTVSTLGFSNTAGAHELSMIYNFVVPVSEKRINKRKSKKQRALFD